MKHILITGVPGIGKTTLVKKLVNRLTESQLQLDGFLTEELRNERFQRVGFSVRLLKSNTSTVLADKTSHSPSPNTRTLGQYTVYVKMFEDLTLQPIIGFDNGILIIDEIGKMELFSKKFEEAVAMVFRKKNITILATVPIRGPPFVERLKKDYDSRLITVTPENRDNLLGEVFDLLVNKK